MESLGGPEPPNLSEDFDLRLVWASPGRNWLQLVIPPFAAAKKAACRCATKPCVGKPALDDGLQEH